MVTKDYLSDDITPKLTQIAHLYYDENLSQQDIADRLGVSRSSIAQYLQMARDRGIVRIEVIDPENSCESKALELREKSGLKRVYVVPKMHQYADLNLRAIAGAASKYLEQNLKDGEIFGMAWGRTITRLSELFAPSVPRQIDVIPLMGERGYTGNYSQINQIVLQTATSFNAVPYFLLTPMFVGTKHLREELIRDEAVSKVVERWDRLTTAVIGIGTIPSSPGSIVYVGEKYQAMMREQGAVGDICGRYFDANGELVQAEFYDRMISISLDQLRNTKEVIAVAGGVEKTRAVISALKSNLISVLFIDEMLADSILHEI